MRFTGTVRSDRELEAVLSGLVRASVLQRRSGLCPPLANTHVRYRREPRGRERWQTAQETFERLEGDCEDLAVYLCSDFLVRGVPARVVVRAVRPGLKHALVAVKVPGKDVWRVVDPSKARGMGRKARG